MLRRELEALRLRLQQESRAERGLPAAGETQEGLLQLCLDKSKVSRWWDFHGSVVNSRYVVYVIERRRNGLGVGGFRVSIRKQVFAQRGDVAIVGLGLLAT